MVVIIKGEVVPDDDPRAIAHRQREQRSGGDQSSAGSNGGRVGSLFGGGGNTEFQQPSQQQQRPGNMYSAQAPAANRQTKMQQLLAPGTSTGDFNARLREYVPPFEIASLTIEPIVILATIVLFALFNVKGLVAAVLLIFFLSQ